MKLRKMRARILRRVGIQRVKKTLTKPGCLKSIADDPRLELYRSTNGEHLEEDELEEEEEE